MEILFKAKDVKTKKWVYGTGVTDFLNIEPDSKDKMWLWCNHDYHGVFGKGWIEIIPETICQYTGLCDHDNNKLFKNDTVRFYELDWQESGNKKPKKSQIHTGVIVFRNGCFQIDGYRMCNDGICDWYSMENLDESEIWKTGNIFD